MEEGSKRCCCPYVRLSVSSTGRRLAISVVALSMAVSTRRCDRPRGAVSQHDIQQPAAGIAVIQDVLQTQTRTTGVGETVDINVISGTPTSGFVSEITQ